MNEPKPLEKPVIMIHVPASVICHLYQIRNLAAALNNCVVQFKVTGDWVDSDLSPLVPAPGSDTDLKSPDYIARYLNNMVIHLVPVTA